MKIHTLHIRNFRRFEDFTFRFHPTFTVLIGVNGFGKTTILDALAVMLGTYLLRFGVVTGRKGIFREEVRLTICEKEDVVTVEPQKPCFLEASGILHEQTLSWTRKFQDRGGSAKHLIQIGEQDAVAVSHGQDVTLPLLGYYGSGRLWPKHRDVPIGKPDSRTVGYRHCLVPRSDPFLFEGWFKKLELTALQKRKEFTLLEGVRTVVKASIPQAKNLYYDITHDAMMIELEPEGLCLFNNLSDGYRNMVAMIADIAHRAARLNPHLGVQAARETPGVVLIDEIDLHLHPKWQRCVVENLKTVFPKVQFIATTHSPFIVQSLNPGEVLDLQAIDSKNGKTPPNDSEIAWPGPGHPYSHRSIEDIVEDLQGISIPQRSARYQAMFDAAKQYYTLLEQGKNADFQEKERIKAKLDELSAPFSENIAYHAFLEMERMAAGLENSNKGGK